MICMECGEPILEGHAYLVNSAGQKIHEDCQWPEASGNGDPCAGCEKALARADGREEEE